MNGILLISENEIYISRIQQGKYHSGYTFEFNTWIFKIIL